MNNQTQITPCQAMRRRVFRGRGALSRAVRIAFEPDVGKVVVVYVRRRGRADRKGPNTSRRIPVSKSGVFRGLADSVPIR